MILYPVQKKWKYFIPVIKKTPDGLLKLAARIFVGFQKKEVLGKEMPKRMVVFLTNKCNLKCRHCFYIPHTSLTQELSLEQFQKMAVSCKNRLRQIVFTGGEPLLREDLFDIVLAFAENGCKTVNIITNGTLPEKTRLFLDKIIDKTDLELVFMLSWDGPADLHDAIRGMPGAAEKTLKTLNLLADRRKKNPKSFGDIFVSTSVNRLNFKNLGEAIAQIKSLENIGHAFNFTRSANLHTFGVAKESLSGFDVEKNIILNTDEMRRVLEYLDGKVWGKDGVSLLSLINRQTMQETIRILENRTNHFKCLAGKSEFIIYPDGNVGICEMLKPIGNLKETGWNVPEFYRRHQELQSPRKCRCTHDCAILSSIRFSPESLFEMLKYVKNLNH